MNAKSNKAAMIVLVVVLAAIAGCRDKRNVRASEYTYLDAPSPDAQVYTAPVYAEGVAPHAEPEVPVAPGQPRPTPAPIAPVYVSAPLPAAPAGPGDDQPELTAEGIEPLTRGPVHEAFAEPTTGAAEAPLVVKRQAPPDVPEVPPEEKPAGDNVIWIPGYWGWDTDRQDFIWVSGLWRAIPPGMRWIGGYWTPALGGWRWVSGFWVAAAAQQIQYVSAAPPEPVVEEPIGAAPSEDSYWAPGCWIYVSTTYRYGWRHGFWVTGRSDWCWVPAHWIWTPRGCVFVDGYWDHSLARRGMLFAPVCFTRPVYRQPRFVYCPTIAINITVLPHHLFVRTGDRHYVFGDYYAARNRKAGIVPLVEFQARRGAFDPIFAQEKWSHRKDDPRWGDTERKRYESLRDNKAPRPAATFVVQQEQLKAAQKTALKPAAVPTAIPPMLTRPVRDVAADKTAALRVEKITPAAREDFLKKSRDLSSSIVTRSRVETGLQPAKTEGPTLGPTAPKVAPVAPASPFVKPATPAAPIGPVAPAPKNTGIVATPPLVGKPATPPPAPVKVTPPAPIKVTIPEPPATVEPPPKPVAPAPKPVAAPDVPPVRPRPPTPNLTPPAPPPTPRITPAEPPKPSPVETPRPAPVEPPRPAPVETPRPTPVVTPKPAPVEIPRPAPVETPRPAPAPTPPPAPVETPRPAPAPTPPPAPVETPRPAPVETPRPAPAPTPPPPPPTPAPAPAPSHTASDSESSNDTKAPADPRRR